MYNWGQTPFVSFYFKFPDLAVLPDQVNGLAGAGADAADVAVGPGGRQCRQRIYLLLIGPKEHLHHSGTTAEVPVYLER